MQHLSESVLVIRNVYEGRHMDCFAPGSLSLIHMVSFIESNNQFTKHHSQICPPKFENKRFPTVSARHYVHHKSSSSLNAWRPYLARGNRPRLEQDCRMRFIRLHGNRAAWL